MIKDFIIESITELVGSTFLCDMYENQILSNEFGTVVINSTKLDIDNNQVRIENHGRTPIMGVKAVAVIARAELVQASDGSVSAYFESLDEYRNSADQEHLINAYNALTPAQRVQQTYNPKILDLRLELLINNNVVTVTYPNVYDHNYHSGQYLTNLGFNNGHYATAREAFAGFIKSGCETVTLAIHISDEEALRAAKLWAFDVIQRHSLAQDNLVRQYLENKTVVIAYNPSTKAPVEQDHFNRFMAFGFVIPKP